MRHPRDQLIQRLRETLSLAVDDIEIPCRLRSLKEDAVARLISSIEKIGLQTPISIRWRDSGDESGSQYPELVAGRHRLEACRRLGMPAIAAVAIDDDVDARLWEIAENLHRADLTVQERADHIAEWVRLTEEKVQSAQFAPIESKRSDGRGHRSEGGINAAVRELGIDRTEAQRAVKIASMPEAAKTAAKETGLDNNQSALLKAAKSASPEAELRRLKAERDAKESARRNRDAERDLKAEAHEEFAAALNEIANVHQMADFKRLAFEMGYNKLANCIGKYL